MWFPYSLFPIQTTSLFLPRRCLFLCGWCKDTKWKAIGRSQVCFYVFFSVFPWWFSEQAINRRMLVFLGMYSVLLEPIQLGFCFKRKEINQNPQSNTAIFMWVSSFFALYLFSWWFSHQTNSNALRNSHARYIKKMNQQNLIMICKIIIKSSV